MDDALVVRFFEGHRDLPGELLRLFDGDGATLHSLREVFPVDQLEN